MNKFAEKWNAMTAKERFLLLAVVICALAVIVLCILELFGIWENADLLLPPLSAVILFCQFLQHWQLKNRGIALFSLCVSLFLLIVFAVKLFL